MEKIKFKDLSTFLKFAVVGGIFEFVWFSIMLLIVIIAFISDLMGV